MDTSHCRAVYPARTGTRSARLPLIRVRACAMSRSPIWEKIGRPIFLQRRYCACVPETKPQDAGGYVILLGLRFSVWQYGREDSDDIIMHNIVQLN